MWSSAAGRSYAETPRNVGTPWHLATVCYSMTCLSHPPTWSHWWSWKFQIHWGCTSSWENAARWCCGLLCGASWGGSPCLSSGCHPRALPEFCCCCLEWGLEAKRTALPGTQGLSWTFPIGNKKSFKVQLVLFIVIFKNIWMLGGLE